MFGIRKIRKNNDGNYVTLLTSEKNIVSETVKLDHMTSGAFSLECTFSMSTSQI